VPKPLLRQFQGFPEIISKSLDKTTFFLYNYSVMKKYANNPYLQILHSLPNNDQIAIRNKYPKDTYDKLDGNEKGYLRGAVKRLSENKKTKIANMGEIGALQLLAAISQYLDSIDWPKRDGNDNQE